MSDTPGKNLDGDPFPSAGSTSTSSGRASISKKLPISFQTDIVGVIGVTLLVVVLMWPAIGEGRAMMSDSWRLNYPWAVEEPLVLTELGEEYPELIVDSPEREEPYILEYDIYLEAVPWYRFAQEEIRAGRFPHWNPYAFCGAPFYANHLVPLTHPPLLIALLTAPAMWVHTVATFLTWWLGALGLYFYLRSKGLGPIAGITSASLYLASGHYMPLVPFQMAGLMYYPWLMWASDALDSRPSFRAMLPFSILLGLQLASGHPAYVAPFLYLLVLHRIFVRVFSKEKSGKWKRSAGYFVVAIVLGFGISAVQNVPTWNYLNLSSRKITSETSRTLPAESAMGEAADVGNGRSILGKLEVVLVPVFQREIEREHPYVGIPMVLLAILGLMFMKPGSDRKAMGLLLLIFTLLAIPSVFRTVGHLIPGLGLSPYNPYAPAQFLLVIVAGYGINGIAENESEISGRWRTVFAILTGTGLAVFAWPMLVSAILSPEPRWARESVALGVIVLITGAIAIAILPTIFTRKKSSMIGGMVVPLIITVAGITSHFYQYPVFQRMPVMPETESIAAMPETNMYRVIRHSSKLAVHAGSADNPLTFGGNLPMWAGWMDSQGYDSFVLENQWNVLRELDPGSLAWNGLALPITSEGALESPILDHMAVKYVISDDPGLSEEYPDLELIHSGGLQIYERENAAPRWYLGASTGSAQDQDNLVVEWDGEVERGLGEIVMAGETPSRLEFEIDAESDCWMVLSDAWHPQWSASLDGERTAIFKVNGAYRGVKIPPGEHSLIFEYDPRDFGAGLLISILSVIILIIGCGTEITRTRGDFRARGNG